MKKLLILFLIIFTCIRSFSQTTFSYNVPVGTLRTSGAIFRGSDSVMVRTAFVDSSLASGQRSYTWDGKDDYGVTLAAVGYYMKVVTNAVNFNWDGVIGNTSTAQSGVSVHKALYTSIAGMAAYNQYAYFCSGYSEGQPSVAKFDTANPQVRIPLSTYQNGVSNLVADFVVSDGTLVYYSGWNAYATAQSCVFAVNPASNDAKYSFSAGTAYTDTHFNTSYGNVADYVNQSGSRIKGLAVSSSYLFVAHGVINELHVMNKTTGALVQNLSITSPGCMFVDGTNLWMKTGTNTIAKYTINANGTLSAATLTLSGVGGTPGAISVNGGNVMVVDGDESGQVVRVFDKNTGVQGAYLGTLGGYFGSPAINNYKYLFNDMRVNEYNTRSFLCTMPNGSFWVGDAGTYREIQYNSNKQYMRQIMSLGDPYTNSVDINNTSRVFANYIEFNINYSQTISGSTGWTATNNWGARSTHNSCTQRLLNVVTLSNGRTYGSDKGCGVAYSSMGFVELTDTGFRSCSTSPGLGIINKDGSYTKFTGSYVAGSNVTYTKYPLSSFNGNNDPVWSGTGTVLLTTPTNSNTLPNNMPGNVSPTAWNFVTTSGRVISYNPSTLVGGGPTTWSGYHLGAIKSGGNTWLWLQQRANSPTYNGPFPTEQYFEIGNTVNQYAGSNVNVVGNVIITGYHGEFWKQKQVNRYNVYNDDGIPIGRFGTDGSLVVAGTAAIGYAGNALSPIAVSGATSDTIYLYHGDESQHAGLHRWTLSNLNSIATQIATTPSNRYYVSSSGSDSYTAVQAQSQATPWKTIAKVNASQSIFNAGDSILYKRGDVFSGTTLRVAKSGAVGSPIVYGSYGGTSNPKPVFDALKTIGAWTLIAPNIYESAADATLGTSVSILTINGTSKPMGRYPNSGWLYYQSHSGTTSITSNQITGSTNWTGAELALRTARYRLYRLPISSQVGGTISYSNGSSVIGGSTITDNFGFFIQNDVRTLDSLFEWYYNPSTKKVSVYFGANNPNSYIVRVNNLDTLISNRNIDNINYDNLTLQGAGYRAVDFYGSDSISFKNSTVTNSGNYGLFAALAMGIRVDRDSIINSNNTGIDFVNMVDRCSITNSYIAHNGEYAGMGDNVSNHQYENIYFAGVNSYIQNNKIKNSGFTSVRFDGDNFLIDRNSIDSFCYVLDDGGGIVTVNPDTLTIKTNRVISNNVITNGIGAGMGTNAPLTPGVSGIYMDDDANNITIIGNTSAYSSKAGILLHNAKNITVRNNTCFGNGEYAFTSINDMATRSHTRGLIIKKNIFVSTTGNKSVNFKSVFNDINLFGIIDSNIIARPIDDNLTITSTINTTTTTQRNLASWQTFSGFDINSTKNPRAITNDNQIVFPYNPTGVNLSWSLSGNKTDLKNVAYSGNITLLPYTSLVLIPASAVQTTPVITWATNLGNYTSPYALTAGNLNASASVAGSFIYKDENNNIVNIGTILAIGSHVITAFFTPTDGVNYTSAQKSATIQINGGGGQKVCVSSNGGNGVYLFNHQNYNGTPLNLYGDDTLCINAGTYNFVSIFGLVGTPGHPIVVINNGMVITGTASYSYKFTNCQYVKFTGTGSGGTIINGKTYGFEGHWAGGKSGATTNIGDSCSDFEVDHIWSEHAENGFIIKINPSANQKWTWRGHWIMANFNVHDNYTHNSYGEGLYGVNTDQYDDLDSSGTTIRVLPVPGTGWNVHDNVFDSTGWDAIQLASCTGCNIYNNYAYNYGTRDINSQQAGIILGGRSNGSIFNNTVIKGTGNGIEYYGWGKDINMVNIGAAAYIYNNIVDSAGWSVAQKQDNIYFDSRTAQSDSLKAFVWNNTLTNAGRYSISTFGTVNNQSKLSRANNNLLVHPGTSYFSVQGGVVLDTTYNQRVSTIAGAGFVNYAVKNFAITGSSSSFNTGEAIPYVTNDIIGTTRPQSIAYDAGAYEYVPTGTKINPTITWANQSMVYNTAISATQTATSGGVAGTFSYNISGTPSVGTYPNYTVTFTPTDQSTYNIVSKTVTLTVTPANATSSFVPASLTQTWNGMPLQPQVITNPVNLAYSITFNNVGQIPKDTGTYAVKVGITDINYSAQLLTGSFRINPAPATISVNNATQTYDSTLKQISVTTSPAGLPFTISIPAKRYSGSYAFTVTLNDSNHTATPVSGTFTITKGTTSLTSWTPTNLTYPNPIGAGQTNAIFAKNGTATYAPIAGTVLAAGIQPLRVDFVPSDTNLLPINNIIRNITVSKGTGTITLGSDTTQYADGTAKTITPILTPNTGTPTVVYTGGHTALGNYSFTVNATDPNWNYTQITGTLHILSNSGTIFISNYQNRVYTGSPIDVTVNSAYTYDLVYTPSNHTNVNSNIQVIATINDGINVGADTVIMNIIKATPTYTWPPISGGAWPFIITGGMLNGSSPTPGVWTYNVSVGDTLSVGTINIIGTFTPTDGANYNSLVVTNSITVTGGTAVINILTSNYVYDGTPKSVIVSTIPPNLDSLVILYNGSPMPPTDAGAHPFTVHLDNANVTAPDVSGTLVISQGSYILSWSQPAPIQVGTALSATQLNPTSSIPGTFYFNYTIGTILPPSTVGLVGTFTPTDSVNYPVQTIMQTISVYGSPFINILVNPTYENLPNQ